jgi:hypothetical protein
LLFGCFDAFCEANDVPMFQEITMFIVVHTRGVVRRRAGRYRR